MTKLTRKDASLLLRFAQAKGSKTTADLARLQKKPYNTVRRWLSGEHEPSFTEGVNFIKLTGADLHEVLTIKDPEARTAEQLTA